MALMTQNPGKAKGQVFLLEPLGVFGISIFFLNKVKKEIFSKKVIKHK
jgi:hypothetical protein